MNLGGVDVDFLLYLNARLRPAGGRMEGSFTSVIPRYYEIECPRVAGPGRSPLLIALHGYQGDKDSMMRVARRIAPASMVVISLQGQNQFFVRHGTNDLTDPKTYRVAFGWGTSYKMDESVRLHHRAIRKLIRLAVRKHSADPGRVFLLAFSQACAYNYRYAFSYPNEIRGVIGVCGGVPHDWHENPRYRPARTHVLHIAATDDEWFTREKNLENKLKLEERAASVDFRFYDSEHRFPRRSIPHIRRWIQALL
jgi:predicted esterase